MKERRGYAHWRKKQLKNRTSDQKTITEANTRVLCPPNIGAEFEDTWRRAVMIDGIDERFRHLFFDYDDSRFSSTTFRNRMRDLVLGFGPHKGFSQS